MAAANSPLDQMLLEFGIDLTPVKNAGEQIKAVLDAVNSIADRAAERTNTTARDQQKQLAEMRFIAASAVQEATRAIAQESQKNAVLKSQTEQIKQQQQERLLAIKSAEAETAELKKQTAELQKQITEKRLAGGGAGGEGGGGGLGFLATATTAVLGKGLIGTITGGILAGEGVKAAVEGVGRFIEKMKEMQDRASQFTLVNDQFEKLARGAGVDATQMMRNLQQSTDGLVDKLTLTRFAARALESGLKGFSPDKINEVAGAMVKLAETSGHTAAQAMEALESAFTRGGQRAGQMLSSVTGLTRAQLQLANLSPWANRTERDVESLNHAFALIIAQAAQLGEIPHTLQQAATQIHVLSEDLLLSFGKGFNQAPGTQAFLSSLSEMIGNFHSLEEAAESFGRTLGNWLPLITVAVQTLVDVFKVWYSYASTIVKELFSGNDAAVSFGDGLNFAARNMIALGTATSFVLQIVKAIVVTAKAAIIELTDILNPSSWMNGQFKKDWEDVGKAMTQVWGTDFSNIAASGDAQIERLNKMLDMMRNPKTYKGRDTRIPPPDDDSNRKVDEALLAARKALQEAILHLNEEQNKALLAAKRDEIDQEKALDNQRYRDGEEALEKHLKVQTDLLFQARQAQLNENEANYNAQILELQNQRQDVLDNAKITGEPKNVTQAKLKPIDVKEQGLVAQKYRDDLKATGDYIRATAALEAEGDKDRLAARKTRIQGELVVEEQAAKTKEALLQKQVKSGDIAPDEYFQQRISLIEELAAKQIQAAQDVYDFTAAKDIHAEEIREANIKKYVQSAKDQIAILEESLIDVQLQAIQHRYGPQQAALESEAAAQQAQPGQYSNSQSRSTLSDLVANLTKQRTELEALLNSGAVQKGSDQWFQIYDNVEKTYQTQVKYNAELQKMVDIMQPVGALFERVGQAITANFHSQFAQGLGNAVQAGAKSIQQSTELGRQISGKNAVPKDPALQKLEDHADVLFVKAQTSADKLVSPFERLSNSIQGAINKLDALAQKPTDLSDLGSSSGEAANEALAKARSADIEGNPTFSVDATSRNKPASNFGDTVKDWSGKIIASISAIDNFTQSIMNAHSALGGAAGGAMGGAGLGNTLDQVFKGLGPFGAIGGAVIGGVAGAIVGNKQAQVTRQITDFQSSFKDIMKEFAENTNNLESTIEQISSLIGQVQMAQSSSKKGGAQFQQLITQYTDQLQQLQNQQLAVIRNLQEQVGLMGTPLPAQSFVSDLQSIMKQYIQFIGAARPGTSDLADAMTYLNDATSKYAETLSEQVLQDNTQAINDALQLNDLIYQRNQMILQYNNSVSAALSQGVLTRQMTRAQTAGQAVEQLSIDYTRQREQIDEQIAAATARVTAENQIFNLATTRVGLENQLLTAQNAQTVLDMQRIAALSQLVAALSSGDFSLLPGLSDAIASEINSLPNYQGPSATDLDTLITNAYQNRANQGFAAFRGTNL